MASSIWAIPNKPKIVPNLKMFGSNIASGIWRVCWAPYWPFIQRHRWWSITLQCERWRLSKRPRIPSGMYDSQPSHCAISTRCTSQQRPIFVQSCKYDSSGLVGPRILHNSFVRLIPEQRKTFPTQTSSCFSVVCRISFVRKSSARRTCKTTRTSCKYSTILADNWCRSWCSRAKRWLSHACGWAKCSRAPRCSGNRSPRRATAVHSISLVHITQPFRTNMKCFISHYPTPQQTHLIQQPRSAHQLPRRRLRRTCRPLCFAQHRAGHVCVAAKPLRWHFRAHTRDAGLSANVVQLGGRPAGRSNVRRRHTACADQQRALAIGAVRTARLFVSGWASAAVDGAVQLPVVHDRMCGGHDSDVLRLHSVLLSGGMWVWCGDWAYECRANQVVQYISVLVEYSLVANQCTLLDADCLREYKSKYHREHSDKNVRFWRNIGGFLNWEIFY